MYFCKIFSVFLFLCNTLLLAQKVIIVCNYETKNGIANVTVFSDKYSYITDNNGLLELPKTLPSDSIYFSHVAYSKTSLLYKDIKDTVFLRPKNLITDEITITAKYTEQGFKQTIDINNVQKSNFATIGDLIKAESDLFIKDYGGVSGVKGVSLRGLSSENTVVLFNEARINDMRTGMFDFSLISPLAIDKIEIIKNNSIESSYFSAGGIVKLSSGFNAAENKILFGAKANSDFYRSVFFNIKQIYNNFNYSINFERGYSSNNYKYNFEGIELRRQNAFFSKSFLSADIEYRTSKNILNLYTHYSHLKNGIPGFVVNNNTSSSSAYNLSKMYFFVANNNYLLQNNWFILGNVSYNYQNLYLYDPLKQIFSNKTSQSSILHETSGFVKSRYNKNNFIIHLGYEFTYSNLKNEMPTENNIFLNINKTYNKLFINGSYSITSVPYSKEINFFVGFGYDFYKQNLLNTNKGNLFSYNTQAEIKPAILPSLRLLLSFSKLLRAPSFNEQFYSSLYNLKFLNNEYYEGYDFTIDYDKIAGTDINFTATYYNLISKDKIVWIPSRQALQTPKNYGHIRYTGVEVKIESSFFKNLINVNVLYNYNNALSKSKMFAGDNSFNKQLVYVPKERININTSINYKNITLNVYNSFTGERFYSSDNSYKNRLNQYYVCDASLSYFYQLLSFKHNISFSVFNIFNTDYFVIQSYPMPLRNYSITYIMEIL